MSEHDQILTALDEIETAVTDLRADIADLHARLDALWHLLQTRLALPPPSARPLPSPATP